LLPPVERRRWCSEHEHANEGDRERAPHERLRRNRTSTTCTQRDGPSWTKRSHRQPPLWGRRERCSRSLTSGFRMSIG
jgi:hypothetical protein